MARSPTALELLGRLENGEDFLGGEGLDCRAGVSWSRSWARDVDHVFVVGFLQTYINVFLQTRGCILANRENCHDGANEPTLTIKNWLPWL